MAEIHLEIDDRSRLGEVDPSTAYLCSLDLAPWNAQWQATPRGWTLQFSESDSPRLQLPVRWNADGQVMLSTATLRPGPRPYRLWLEIARGTVDRLRNRVASWQVLGFEPSNELQNHLRSLSLDFCTAMAREHRPQECEPTSIELIDRCLADMDLAAREYVAWQRSAGDTQTPTNSSTLRGTWLDTDDRFPSVAQPAQVASALDDLVNTVVVRPRWEEVEARPNQWDWSSIDRRLEAANARPWNVVLGPLISFQRSAWPDWLLAQSDPNEIRRAVQRWVAKLMERYAGQVDLVILADRINVSESLRWDGHARLQLVIDAGTTLRRAVDNLPYVVGFTQPFSEGQPRGVDYPAFHLADALMRANLEICGFALDFEFGAGPHETRPRDICQLIERLTHWGSFGLPLVINTSAEERSDAEWVALRAKKAGLDDDRNADPDGAGRILDFTLTGAEAAEWVQPHFQRWLEILDASSTVDAVFWNHAIDSLRPGRGLIDETGEATQRARVLRRSFGLADPDDTLPI